MPKHNTTLVWGQHAKEPGEAKEGEDPEARPDRALSTGLSAQAPSMDAARQQTLRRGCAAGAGDGAEGGYLRHL